MKLTLAITVYNRYELLLESFANVIDDDRIDEVLIMDDASEDEYWNKIKELPKFNPKIKVVRQLTNQGMSRNKRDAVFNSKNEWVLVGDSDNVFGKDYLDAFEKQYTSVSGNVDTRTIYAPQFAKPQFDFTPMGHDVSLRTIKDLAYKTPHQLSWFLNCCNYIVNRETYLAVWLENKTMKGSDTIWMAYLWMVNGNEFYIVPGMHYFHRVHDQSGFLQDAEYNLKKAEEIKRKILDL